MTARTAPATGTRVTYAGGADVSYHMESALHPRLTPLLAGMAGLTVAGEVVLVDSIPSDQSIFDIGPETAREYARVIAGMKTVLWNGPLGVGDESDRAVGAGVQQADGLMLAVHLQ
mgnify:CR=1 FL=1